MKNTLTILFLALTVIACGQSQDANGPTGRYSLENTSRFADNAAEVLISTGKIPAGARDLAIEQLRACAFDLDLSSDKTFTFEQTVSGKHMTYTGNWYLNGNSIRLEQTHENGNKVEDMMKGQLRDGRMSLSYEESGAKLEFVLARSTKGTPASPR